jgi:hypothetical protein
VSLTPEQEHLWVIELEKMGETQVRSDLERGKISPGYFHLASRWLAEKEREAKADEKASRAKQIELMQRQATAAERANTRASIAIGIAVASALVTAIGTIVTVVATWKALR